MTGVGVATRIVARARIGERTKDLVRHLEPGEIAVINHPDIDPVAAAGLIEAGAVAVVNAAASFTGRYPNLGALQLVRNGIVMIDDVGTDVLERIGDAAMVTLDGGAVLLGDELIGVGHRWEEDELLDRIAVARRSVGEQLTMFAANTLEYLTRERHLATDNPDLPATGVRFAGRQALIVARGAEYREDLATLDHSGYLGDAHPVMIGVDGGADALLALGHTPDIIIGDFDSVSERALRCGAELIVHAYCDGRAPGAERLQAMGLPHVLFENAGTSEDIAMLLAYEQGAERIVAVGSRNSLEEFLDKGRSGMASTFLVRLKVGRILVDAKGLNNLYRSASPVDTAAIMQAR